MCRALKVLCVAPDAERLAALRRATVSAEWELSAGATSFEDALSQLAAGRAHLMVVSGEGFAGLLAAAREVYPGLRIVADFAAPEVDAEVASLDEIRTAIKEAPRPRGPVRSPDPSA